ncbi:MAG: Hsp20/alpha crystallin family protein, partial [Raoultibacter sp.]
MLLPARKTRDIIDGLMIDPFETFLDNASALAKSSSTLMKTDILETDKGYELTIDLPGFKKEDVTAELSDGYLSVTASTESVQEEKNHEGSFIRKERFSGKCSRQFFVGDNI